MGNPYASDAGSFLVETIFGFYILIVMLRFIFQLTQADFYNPISQLMVKLTNPPLRFLRRFIPDYGGIDLASIALLVILAVVKIYILYTMFGRPPQFTGALLGGIADLLNLAVNVFIVAIFIMVILSWIGPRGNNSIISLVHSVTQPVLAPARRLIPAMGGLDLSPIAVFIVLTLFQKLFIQPLYDLSATMI